MPTMRYFVPQYLERNAPRKQGGINVKENFGMVRAIGYHTGDRDVEDVDMDRLDHSSTTQTWSEEMIQTLWMRVPQFSLYKDRTTCHVSFSISVGIPSPLPFSECPPTLDPSRTPMMPSPSRRDTLSLRSQNLSHLIARSLRILSTMRRAGAICTGVQGAVI